MERHIQADNAFIKWMVAMSKNVVHIADAWYAAVKWADSHPHWIPVEERLPKVGEPVWFYTPSMDEPLKGAYQENGTWYSVEYECKFINDVTHWMEIQPPRKEKRL